MSYAEDQFCFCIESLLGTDGEKAAALNAARWKQNAMITIRFLGGTKKLQDRVAAVAKEWTAPGRAGLNLLFQPATTRSTHIRIAFLPGRGSWSYLGTVCQSIPEPRPTMNFGWINENSPDSVLRPVVLHEFGHALGLIHEHQNPISKIKWNKPAVKADLSGPPNNWDDATIENNMFKAYSTSEVYATPVDMKSIMMYPIPKSWTLDGTKAGTNSDLSPTDIEHIKRMYP